MKIKNWKVFVGHIVFLNAPRGMTFEEKREIQAQLEQSFAPVAEFFSMKELSHGLARATYFEARARGWRKKRNVEKDGRKGKSVCWCRDF